METRIYNLITVFKINGNPKDNNGALDISMVSASSSSVIYLTRNENNENS